MLSKRRQAEKESSVDAATQARIKSIGWAIGWIASLIVRENSIACLNSNLRQALNRKNREVRMYRLFGITVFKLRMYSDKVLAADAVKMKWE